MKSLIIYASHHHGNTEKLVRNLASRYDITLVNADKVDDIDFDGYDLIGFASGLDFGRFYPSVTDIAAKLPAGKAVYAVYTCARDNAAYGSQIEEIALSKGCRYLGKFCCKGYNTYGPLRLIGGMNKRHPDENDLENLCTFYQSVLDAK